jgi:hypothetical protein
MENLNILQTAGGHLAAIGLTKAGKGPLGVLISPAVWLYNWQFSGSTPSSVDGAFYAISLAGGIFAPVALAASYVKALMDDDIERKVNEARQTEPALYRPGIQAIVGWGPPSALAGEFAMAGGTSWQAPNGIWVTIVDANKRLIPNYKPVHASAIRRPVWPLTAAPNGSGYMIEDKLDRMGR